MDRSSTFQKITATLSLNLNVQTLKRMPRKIAKKNKQVNEFNSLELTDEICDNIYSCQSNGKRSYESTDKTEANACFPNECSSNKEDYENDLQKMLEIVGADFNKCRQTKKQRLEQYSKNIVQINVTKIKRMKKCEEIDRKQLFDEYKKNVFSIFEQWDEFISISKDREEKLQKIIHQQTKMIHNCHNTLLQRLASIRQMHASYFKKFVELEFKQEEECNYNQLKLRNELNNLQEEFMEEAKKTDMAQLKRHFQNMLFM